MNQHYVPKVYLKNFAMYNGKDYYVNVYDKLDKRYFKTNIKNICSETHLYTLDDSASISEHKFAVEKLYSDFIEPLYEKAYDILTNDNIFRLTDEQRVEIFVGIFQLYFRNPIVLRHLVDSHLDNVEKIYHQNKMKGIKGLTYLDEDFSFREYSLDDIFKAISDKSLKLFKEQHVRATANIAAANEFAKIEVEKIIDNSADFLTNDNPLYFDDALFLHKNPFQKSNEFILPLNKKYLVRIYHDNTKGLNVIYRRKTLNGNVHLINTELYEKSRRFVIGDKATIEEMERLAKVLEEKNTLETKMDIVRQILSDENIMRESPEGTRLLKHYYNLYLLNNGLLPQEEYEMHLQLNALTIKKRESELR